MKRRTLVLVLAVAAVVVVAGVSVYVLTRPPPIPLTVTDGSTTGVVFGDFEHDTDSAKPLFFYFNATSVAHTSGGRFATLAVQVSVSAFYSDVEGVVLSLSTRVHGRFASDLSVLGRTLACNVTGEYAGAYGDPYTNPNSVNVSSNPLLPRVGGNGSAHVSPTLVNRTGGNPDYVFAWTSGIEAGEGLTQDAFFGLRASVTGNFAPSVSVGIVLHVLDVPTGTPPLPGPSQALAMTITPSADGTHWVVTLTALPSGFLNTTTDLDLRNDTLGVTLGLGPLGSLYTSPYGTTAAYLPATPGSNQVGVGDRVILSVATYSRGWWVEFSTGDLVVLWGWML